MASCPGETGQWPKYLICYDVTEDFRRERVAKLLAGYGDRIQYSVFRCELNLGQLSRLKKSLIAAIDHADDRVHFVRIGPGGTAITRVGVAYAGSSDP